MPTERQLQNARANGARSRGPVTARDKHNSSFNSLRHGMVAQTVELEGESRERFEQLLDAIAAEIKPRTSIEARLSKPWPSPAGGRCGSGESRKPHSMSKLLAQKLLRLPPARAAVVFRSLGDNSRALDLQHRYETAYDRQFSRDLALLVKLRTVKPDASDDSSLVGPLTCASATWEPIQNEPENEEICGTNPATPCHGHVTFLSSTRLCARVLIVIERPVRSQRAPRTANALTPYNVGGTFCSRNDYEIV